LNLKRNQIDHCSPKGQVGGSNPPRVTKLIKQLQYVTVLVKIYNPKKTPKTPFTNRLQKNPKFKGYYQPFN